MTENNEITENIQPADMQETTSSANMQKPTESANAQDTDSANAQETDSANAQETDSANAQETIERKSRHTRPQDGCGRYFVVRQILNLLFMGIALVGVGLYLWWNEMGGIIIVVIAMAFKMAECVLRYLK